MTVFTMFFIELMAARFDVFGHPEHDLESSDPSTDLIRGSEKDSARNSAKKRKENPLIVIFDDGPAYCLADLKKSMIRTYTAVRKVEHNRSITN